MTGQNRPNSLCQTGFYCSDSIIGIAANNTFTSKDLKYTASPCSAGQYCVGGISSNITNTSDPTAPQPCLAGMVCSSANGNIQCPAGYYCPGDVDPIPAPPGSYVPDVGFVSMIFCAPGTYNKEYSQTSCNLCTPGSYANTENNTACILCPAGTYSDNHGSVYCNYCPQGTYNENIGSKSSNDCISCPEKYLCSISGMSNYNIQGTSCPQGFYCPAGTNPNKLINYSCPPGFWCGSNSSSLADFHLCEDGYYCEAGTSQTNKNKNLCPTGYYCPKGSFPTITNSGIFVSINRTTLYDTYIELISKIDPMIITKTSCPSDSNIPLEIKNNYESIKIYKCPTGTTSKTGSFCLSDCTASDIASVILSINPFNSSAYNLTESKTQSSNLRVNII